MKKIALLISFTLAFLVSYSQKCDSLFVDINKGTLNGLGPKASQEEVKKGIPCFTKSTMEGSEDDCGGGVYFGNHGFYFYTGRDNINIRENFSGKTSIGLIGKTKDEAIKLLGKSAGDLEDNEGVKYYFFERPFGCIVLMIDDGKVREIFLYAKKAEEIDLCT